MSGEKLTRLPAGRHGLSRELVASNQRERLIDAFARLIVDRGYRATTVSDITTLASVSRNVFYEQFEGKDECYIAAFEVVRSHIRELMREAAEVQQHWPEKVVAALGALLDYYAAEPGLARLCLTEPLSAGPTMSAHYEESLDVLASRLEETRAAAGGKAPENGDEVLVLGAITVIARRINQGETDDLRSLLPELAQILLSSDFSQEKIAEIVATVEKTSTANKPADD